MPIVPTVNQNPSNSPAMQAPSVEPMRNFAPQQIEEMGQTVAQAGSVMQSVAARIQDQLDSANIKAAETQYIKTVTDLLHGENGLLNKQGADALNADAETRKAIAKAKQDILGSLGNDRQKQNFTEATAAHDATFGAQIGTHVARERNKYVANEALSSSDALRVMAQQEEIGSPKQKAYIDQGLKERKKALVAMGIPEDSEQAKQVEREYRTNILEANVTRLINEEKFDAAQLYFNEHASEVDQDTPKMQALKQVIEARASESKVVSFVDRNWKPGMSASEMDSQIVETFKDPKERKLVRQEWGDREQAYQADREVKIKKEVASVWDAEMKGTPTRKLFSAIDQLPTLDATQKKTLKKQVEDMRQAAADGPSRQQQYAVNMIPYLTDPTLAANLSNEDIKALAPTIGPGNVMFLSKMVGELQNAKTFPVPPEILKAEISRAGWNMKDKAQADMVTQAYQAATNELLLRKQNGEKVGRQQIEQTLRANLASFETVTKDRTFWFDQTGKLPLGVMTDQQLKDAVKELPTAEVRQFSAYTQHKYGVSTFSDSTQFLRAFNAWKQAGSPQAPAPAVQQVNQFGSIQ